MLRIVRNVGESLRVGAATAVVVEAAGGRATFLVDCPRDVPVYRQGQGSRADSEVCRLRAEVAAVLAQLYKLAVTCGDEGQFRRCCDRLRALITEVPSERPIVCELPIL